MIEPPSAASTFFDPLWAHRDGRDVYAAAPFDKFLDFFRPFDAQFERSESLRSHQDFFPGAFAFHWHNQWATAAVGNSYFGLFDRDFDAILHEKLKRTAGSPRG